MKKHLIEIKKIFRAFIKKHSLLEYYLTIEGFSSANSRGSYKISDYEGFDKYTVSEFKKIKRDLADSVAQYLEENNIKATLYVNINRHYGEIYFKESIDVNNSIGDFIKV